MSSLQLHIQIDGVEWTLFGAEQAVRIINKQMFNFLRFFTPSPP
jgi:hypothetical protein